MCALPEYQYKPLQSHREIRLVILHAADSTSPNLVSCHLQHASFDSDVSYTAISYCWGDPKVLRPIVCEGSLLHVTVNLYNALRDWRPVDGNIQLWADAICINQKDNEEKSSQVKMMGDIYSRAAIVWVWLGESSETTSRAYRSMDEIYDHFELGDVDDKYFLKALASSPWRQELNQDLKSLRSNHIIAASAAMRKVRQELAINSLVPGDMEDWQALSDVFSLPWFSRKWIIQEVALAQKALIFCGVQSISWPRLREVSAVLPTCIANMTLRNSPIDRDYTLLFSGLNRVPGSAAIATSSAGRSMLFLLASTSEFECTDPRDRYFALYSLSTERMEASWPLKPNYDLELQDISFEFGKWHILTKQKPDILNLVEPDVPPSSRSPSWVPSFGSGHPLLIAGELEDMAHWQCSGSSILEVQTCDRERTLRIKGKAIDLITRMESSFSVIELQAEALWSSIPSLNTQSRAGLSPSTLSLHNEEDTWRNLPLIRLLQPAVRFRDMIYQLVEKAHKFGSNISATMREALLDALTFDIIDPKSKPDPECCKTFLDVLAEIPRNPRPGADLQELMQNPKFYTLYEALACESRYYCATEKDMVAVVPRASQVGDKICLFYGCRTPYVIRPVNDGTYYFVGPCYLHGMMQGEAMQMSNLDEDFFILR